MEGGPEGGSSAAAMGNEFKVAHENLLKIEADERAEKVNKAGTETAEQAEFKQFNRNFKSEGPLFPKTEQQPPQEKKGIFSRFFRREAVNTIDQNSVDYVANKYGLTDEEKNNLNSLPPEERAAYGSLREAARLRERIAMDKENMQQKAKNQRIESITNQDPRYVTKEAKAAKIVEDRRDQGYQAVAKEMDTYLNETSSTEAEPTDADLAQIETATNKIVEDSSAPVEELGVVGAESEAAGDEGVEESPLPFMEKDAHTKKQSQKRDYTAEASDLDNEIFGKDIADVSKVVDELADNPEVVTQTFAKESNLVDPLVDREKVSTILQYPDRFSGKKVDDDGQTWNISIDFGDSAAHQDKQDIRIRNRNGDSVVTKIQRSVMVQRDDESGYRYIQTEEGEWFRAKIYPAEPGREGRRYLFLGDYQSSSMEEVSNLSELVTPLIPEQNNSQQFDLTPNVDFDAIRERRSQQGKAAA